jgi:hypothetical protein
MISYKETAQGLIILSRCNRYHDHKKLKNDGDIILGVIPKEGFKDIADAKYLINKLNQRLKRYSTTSEELAHNGLALVNDDSPEPDSDFDDG